MLVKTRITFDCHMSLTNVAFAIANDYLANWRHEYGERTTFKRGIVTRRDNITFTVYGTMERVYVRQAY